MNRLARRKSENTFYCFSPPVMIATFCIEMLLAIYTLWRYKMSAVTRLVATTLVSLAAFQLAEFMVCEGGAAGALPWSRMGYVAITLLPPLGLHLAYVLAGAKQQWPLRLAYGAAAVFGGVFLLVPNALNGHACLGNYVIFQVARGWGGLFGLYYYGLLITVLLTGLYYLKRMPLRQQTRQALGGLMLGYSIFIIPTVTVNLMNPQTVRGIPSVMCGFAVLLAVTMVLTVLPATEQREEQVGEAHP